MQRVLIALIALPLLGACPGSSVDGTPGGGGGESRGAVPAPEGGQVTVELTSRVLPAGEGQDARASAQGRSGAAAVEGVVPTPTPCFALTGSARREAGGVVLTVEARDTGEMCAQVLSAVSYQATVRGLAAGTHRLRVVHAYPGTGWETQTVLDTSVTVR